ncbi:MULTISPECIES: hypothetical protein [Clostridium]|nr:MULTISPECIES: hypothetical protein [Clostridium]
MRYCLKDGTISQADCISDAGYIIDTIKIVNGYWYYNTKDNKIRCVKLAK